MSFQRLSFFALLLAGVSGCGSEIGDSCRTSTECSQDGNRICDISSPNGYCTMVGCDFGTCPDEAVCIRFFPVAQLTRDCAVHDDCAVDEVCTLAGRCAPRSTETRYCMKKCSSDGDCRDSYECRDEERMLAHGGEPVPNPEKPDEPARIKPFCAPAQPCRSDADCDFGDRCDLSALRCVR